MPKSVLVIVYTDGGDVLLLQRGEPFEFWQSVTGSLESGETPYDAACRELREETGLTGQGVLTDACTSRVFTIDPRWLNRYAAGVTENIESEWHYRLPAIVDIRITRNEHTACRWFPIDDAIDAVWSWTNKEALQNLMVRLL